jgi:glutamate-1-semialdehyde 2,1-aminomutase
MTDVAEVSSKRACAMLLERARRVLAGGDSSTMRVLPYHLPLVAERGEGSRVWDADGIEYLDLNMAYGPLILGHRPRRVVEAVTRQVSESGSMLGFPTEITVRVAEKLRALFPSMELMRFANSGTEALASSVRLARAVTGRRLLVLFEGHYHGWSESVFHRYHAPLADLPDDGWGPALPGTNGLSRALTDVLVLRWNDLDLLREVLDQHGHEIAAVVMEPVMGNAGVIAPEPGFLPGAREATRAHGALLIFDEVITGLRVAAGGAQELYDVRPDITCVSKAIGGGYPVAAFGASASIMRAIVEGRVFHGGVFSGNALVMSAAEAVLDEVHARRESMYDNLHWLGDRLASGLCEILEAAGVPHVVQHVGPMVSLFLTNDRVDRLTDYREVRRHGAFERYIAFQHAMQRAGVYFHPNMMEPMYLSAAHDFEDVQLVLETVESVVEQGFQG